MASAWGKSWGAAWGNSWGTIEAPLIVRGHGGDEFIVHKPKGKAFDHDDEEDLIAMVALFVQAMETGCMP